MHPRVFSNTSNLPGPMAFTLLASLLAMALLFATLCKYELTAKHTRAQLRALRRRLSNEAGDLEVRPRRSAAPGGRTINRAAAMTARATGRPGG